MKTTTTLLIMLALLLAATAAEARKPYLDLDGELSYDGLFPVKRSVMDQAWARNDIDLTSYDKILIAPAGLHYRPVKPLTGTRSTSARNREFFPVNEDQQARLKKLVGEEFAKQFAKLDRFTVVDEVGPGVLVIRGGIFDIVSRVPPKTIGRSDYYLSSLGGATVVLEFVDPAYNTTIARVVDSRSIEQRGMMLESNPVMNTSQVRQYVRSWASWLRRSLDRIVEIDAEGKLIRE